MVGLGGVPCVMTGSEGLVRPEWAREGRWNLPGRVELTSPINAAGYQSLVLDGQFSLFLNKYHYVKQAQSWGDAAGIVLLIDRAVPRVLIIAILWFLAAAVHSGLGA